MTDKKTTTKGGTKGAGGSKGKGRAGSAQSPDLATLISSLLNHPDIDASLYNTIRDELCEMPREFILSPTFIREQLRARGVPVAAQPPSITVKDLVRAIIADAERYDADTREAVRLALNRDDESLLEFVTRAAAGETVLDLTALGGEESKARRDARRLLERLKRAHDANAQDKPSGYYKPITYAQTAELTEKIVGQDDDRVAHAFITLLHGIAAAYYLEKREGRATPDVDSIVCKATHAAYALTTIASTGADEFALLDADTFDEMDKLRPEYFGEEPS